MSNARALLDSWRGDGAVLDEARDELDAVLAKNPNSAPAHREYARYYIKAGAINSTTVAPEALKSAEKSLKTALELDPNFSDAYVLAGHLYFLQGRNQEAKDALDKAESLGSTDPWLDLNRADLLIADKDFEGAGALCRRVIDSGTTNSNAMEIAHYRIINIFRSLHQDADADKAYRQLIAYAPADPWPHGNYGGFLLCRFDHADEAIAQFRIALGIMNYGNARFGLAAALVRKWAFEVLEGDPAVAAAAMEEAQALSPGDPVQLIESFCKTGHAIAPVKTAVEVSKYRQ